MITAGSIPYSGTLRYSGSLAIDDRGSVAFVNDFDPAACGVRRMYSIQNHRVGFVRAWHAHRREAKYVTAVSGSALVCAVRIDDWDSEIPAVPGDEQRFILSDQSPSVLYIPPSHANGWMSLTEDCRLLWFSTATLDESRADDIRFPSNFWNPWEIEER